MWLAFINTFLMRILIQYTFCVIVFVNEVFNFFYIILRIVCILFKITIIFIYFLSGVSRLNPIDIFLINVDFYILINVMPNYN